MAKRECVKVDRVGREVIEGKLLAALDGEDCYAIALSKSDIDELERIVDFGVRFAIRNGISTSRIEAFLKDLQRFKREIERAKT